MSTLKELSIHIKDRLDGSNRATRDRLAKPLAADGTLLTVTHSDNQIHEGDYLAVNNEVLYVWSDERAPEFEVGRAEKSTTPAAHSQGDVIEVRPSHPLGIIQQDIRHEILQLTPLVYKVQQATISLPKRFRTFELTGAVDPLFPLRFTAVPSDDYGAEEKVSVMIEGTSAHVTGSPRAVDRTLNCFWAEEFDLSGWADDLDLLSEAVGLTETLQDVVHFGVMARRLIEIEALRADVDVLPTSRNAEDFPPGYGIQASASYLAVRDKLLAQEQRRLYERWQPVMI